MSNLEQVVTTGIGATIGFFVGGPAGALAGAQYGLLAGSVLFPGDLPGVQGPRLEDFERLHADPGAPIAQVYGTAAVPGFRLYLGPVTEIASTEEVGGKGAPSQDVTTFHYLQTIALGLCEGPIVGIQRVWENGELVYDTREIQEGESQEDFAARLQMSSAYQQTFTLYLGDEEQLPDPTLETEQGVGNVPAFRGLAYIVFPNRELKPEQGNRHPVFKIEVSTLAAGQAQQVVVAFTNPAANGTSVNTWTVPDGVTEVEVLVVGGGGGAYTGARAGGGGGGGVIYRESYPVTPTTVMPITVGARGTAGGVNGGNSVFGTLTAIGGGGSGADGGSGGGGNPGHLAGGLGTPGQGHNGGDAIQPGGAGTRLGGGGGGAGAPGQQGGTTPGLGGNGGIGLYFGDKFGGEAANYGDEGWFGGGGGGAGGGLGGKGGGMDDWEVGRFAAENDTSPPNSGGGGGAPGVGGGNYPRNMGADGIVIIGYVVGGGGGSEKISIADIVTAICERCGLSSSILDVSELEEREVRGYVIQRETTGHAAIEPLRMVGRFDIVESAGILKFPVRGRVASVTLTEGELSAYPIEEQPPTVTTDKLQDYELPRQIRLRYPSYSRDYENGEQLSPARIGTVGVNDVSVECPVILDDEDAAHIAEILAREAWAGRYSHGFTLGPEHHALEPSDIVMLPVDGRLQRVRLVTIDDSGLMVRRSRGVRDDDGSYVSIAIATKPPRPPALIELIGDTEIEILDLPALREADDDAGMYLAAWRTGTGQSWAGARIHRSVDDGATYQPVLAAAAQAIVGEVVSAPASGDGYTWDEEQALVVELVRGELESRTDAAVLSGANAAAVGMNGRWQIIQFANTELIDTNTYRLTRLLLGRRGTEHLIGTTQPGDRFVLVSGPGIYRLPLQVSEIGAARLYRPVTVGRPFDSAASQEHTGNGAALKCFSPVYVRGERDESGNLTITWIRRDRLSQTLRDSVPVPNSEASEEYEIDILDDSTTDEVVRTISSSTTEAEYSAAHQTADFGSPQDAVRIRIYQLSANVGRGVPAEAIV